MVLKQLTLIIVTALVSSAIVYAQDGHGHNAKTKYKQLKLIYNYEEYSPAITDRYSPTGSGVASFFLPGLGQMICGEFGRGFAFFGGFVGCYYIGGLSIFMGTGFDEDGNVLYHSPGSAIAGTAFITGALAIYVMSIIDAKRVAIVKNMYEQDLNRAYPLEMKVYPSLDYALIGNTYQPTAGIKLAVKF